ncbi:MAG: heavy metal-associated domain-containing protein [Bdellovibrionota bacterium]
MKLFLLAALFALPAFAGETIVNVKGMVCSMCAQGLEKKFTEAGVEKIQVDLDQKQVRLEGKELSDQEIRKIITWAGYEAGDISRK